MNEATEPKKTIIVVCIIAGLILAISGFGSAQGRAGAWVDAVLAVQEPNDAAAISRLEANDIQAWFSSTSNPDLRNRIARNPALAFTGSFGSNRELSFNPVGPVFPGTDRLNPFASPKIREAMNWLIDRKFIAEEILRGLGRPRYLPLDGNFPDFARLADVARRLEIRYAPDPARARSVITAEMRKLGATSVSGKWQFRGKPVTLIFLIRNEDARRAIGEYVANLLEGVGFSVDRRFGSATDLSPLWNSSDPAKGQWHIYTGGWVSTAISRDQSGQFDFFYTRRGLDRPLWQAYRPAPEFDRIADRLARTDFATMAERNQLFARALELAMQDSVRIWLVEELSVSPRRAEVKVVGDLAGGISGSSLWPFTIRYEGRSGGTVRIGVPSMLPSPWNPVGGSNWIFDTALYRATQDYSTISDPFTGLDLPQRVERADVTVKQGLPVTKTLDWVSLQFVPEIRVPEDAIISWNPKTQRFVTVKEKYPKGLTTRSKAVVYFDRDLFKKVQWHDGSALSMVDIMLGWVLTFDRAMEGSAIFDESVVPGFKSFEQTFRGFRIASENPLVVELYSDAFALDAEAIAAGAAGAYWPLYGSGPGPWHIIALGIRPEASGETAFSEDKAAKKKVEQLNYVAGPTLAILDRHLAAARNENFIPYVSALRPYISAEEAKTRWAALTRWREEHGHFWVGMGPFLLQRVSPVEKVVELRRFDRFTDPSTKWVRFDEPKIPSVAISGPSIVRMGQEATFEVGITFRGRSYPAQEIGEVNYLLFDAKRNLVASAAAQRAGERWKIVLPPAVIQRLGAGSSRLEVIVVSRTVSIPSFATMSFTMLPK